MQVSRIQQRGQVTLPRELRQAAGLKPGDLVSFELGEPGTLTLRVIARMRLAEAFERYKIDGPVDDALDREDWQDAASKDVLGE